MLTGGHAHHGGGAGGAPPALHHPLLRGYSAADTAVCGGGGPVAGQLQAQGVLYRHAAHDVLRRSVRRHLSWVTLISELSTAILLYTGKTQTLTVAIYTQIVRGNYGIASAMATVLTVMTLLSLLIFNKISKDGDLTM